MKKEVYDQHLSLTITAKVKNAILKEAKRLKTTQTDLIRQALTEAFTPKKTKETVTE